VGAKYTKQSHFWLVRLGEGDVCRAVAWKLQSVVGRWKKMMETGRNKHDCDNMMEIVLCDGQLIRNRIRIKYYYHYHWLWM